MKQFLISVFCFLSFYGVISNRLALGGDRLTASYYYGYVNVFSPDGSKPLGKTVSLVKRIINQKEKRIIEAVLQPSRNPNQKPKDIVTTLT
ncbi:MAG: hypothetical protein HY843_00075 [Bdellovibrio sp.]|nr:hypothetical protein [Bdellovibrio sp.]